MQPTFRARQFIPQYKLMRFQEWVRCLWIPACCCAVVLSGSAILAQSQVMVTGIQNAGTSSVFDKTQFSIDDPASLWVVVNKLRPLPSGYVPADLVVPHVKLQLSPKSERMHVRAEMAGPLRDLFSAAQKDGYHFTLLSGYRSEAYQKKIYSQYVRKLKTRADAASAQPGYSEHQTGLAVDLDRDKDLRCLTLACFAAMPEARWLEFHAHEYGFIVRYEKGKEGITGYEYEPWHLRYVGKELAEELFSKQETMEEFFGTQTAPVDAARRIPKPAQ
jgi:D-alanyl-D-alanine carboxypeptidase